MTAPLDIEGADEAAERLLDVVLTFKARFPHRREPLVSVIHPNARKLCELNREDLSTVLASRAALLKEVERLRGQEAEKDAAYLERNKLVRLLAHLFPSGTARTSIEGWSDDWHGCVYIDFPWGQASWHFHDSHAHLFANLPPYAGQWDGHTTDEKYDAIVRAALSQEGE